jgi:hypothetical protein
MRYGGSKATGTTKLVHPATMSRGHRSGLSTLLACKIPEQESRRNDLGKEEAFQTLNATNATNATMHIPITKTATAPGS